MQPDHMLNSVVSQAIVLYKKREASYRALLYFRFSQLPVCGEHVLVLSTGLYNLQTKHNTNIANKVIKSLALS